MSERVTMPALGESVTEGTVTRWLKQVGDTVAVDEPLLEVSTDKVDTEIPSPVAGTLQEILVGEDATVPVGADLAVIGEGAASPSDAGSSDAGSSDAGSSDAGSSDAGSSDAGSGEPESSDDEAAAPVYEDGAHRAEPEPEPEAQPEPEATPEQPAAQAEPEGQAQPEAQPATDDSGDGGGSSGGSGGGSGGGTTVTMPALGESVTEGTVTRWLKAEGDSIEVDEPLLEVSTDKVDTEVPSPVAGVVQKILVGEDETVPVGADLAIVGDGSAGGGESAPAAAEPAAATAEPEAQPEPEPEPQQSAPEPAPSGETAPEEAALAAEPTPASSSSTQDQPAAPAEAETPSAPSTEQSEPPGSQPKPAAAAPSQSAPNQSAPSQSTDALGADAATYVTPLVRKLAGEHGVDLTTVSGTGVGGRIRKQDVLAAAQAQQAAAEPEPEPVAAPAAAPAAAPRPATAPSAAAAAKRGTTEKMTRLRRVIAQRMVESLQVSAQLTTVVEVDVTKISRLRDRAKRDFQTREGVKLSFLPFFAQAVVEALKIHPTVNASIEGDEITYHGQENLGIAVDTERGLLVPVIKDAGDLNIAGLARKIADLAERTRTNKIGPDELGGGTFTLTNTGSRGALFDTPIINQPQVAIMGTGSVVRKPVVVIDPDGGETIAIRSMVYLALSYDHRLVDGADAARFLTTVKDRLEDGAFESDLGL
jgi:2-oxoglutarate dehydrogenase E2 component (dihydrolipoamide succinyltransferase)